jgi:hypothetical protein
MKPSVRIVGFWPRFKSGPPELKLEALTLEPTCLVSMLLLLLIMAGKKIINCTSYLSCINNRFYLFYWTIFLLWSVLTHPFPVHKLWACIIISKQVYDGHLHEQKYFEPSFSYKKTCWCSVMYKELQLLDLWKLLMTEFIHSMQEKEITRLQEGL